jgi:hypothetical protein
VVPNRHYYRLPGDDAPSLVTCGTIVFVMLFLMGTLAFILLKVAKVF